MSSTKRSRELATGWIEAWIRMDMEWLHEHLAEDFVHVSPFGRLEGREHYLASVELLARKSVTDLVINRVIADGNEAAIWFENHTPEGVIPSCDWLRIENGEIAAIRSFYDSTPVRGVLSDEEQGRLRGADD